MPGHNPVSPSSSGFDLQLSLAALTVNSPFETSFVPGYPNGTLPHSPQPCPCKSPIKVLSLLPQTVAPVFCVNAQMEVMPASKQAICSPEVTHVLSDMLSINLTISDIAPVVAKSQSLLPRQLMPSAEVRRGVSRRERMVLGCMMTDMIGCGR